jgi:hypothetical protein
MSSAIGGAAQRLLSAIVQSMRAKPVYRALTDLEDA